MKKDNRFLLGRASMAKTQEGRGEKKVFTSAFSAVQKSPMFLCLLVRS